MPVQIDEVVVEPREQPPARQPQAESAGGSQPAAPDPQLELKIAQAVALRRSRDLRLCAD
jgi:hypothetical protein